MTNSYVWNFEESAQYSQPIIVTNGLLSGFIFQVFYNIAVSDNSTPPNTATFHNNYTFPIPTTADGYTDASTVTSTMIMAWLQNSLGATGVAAQQAYADAVLANQVTPPVVLFTPIDLVSNAQVAPSGTAINMSAPLMGDAKSATSAVPITATEQ